MVSLYHIIEDCVYSSVGIGMVAIAGYFTGRNNDIENYIHSCLRIGAIATGVYFIGCMIGGIIIATFIYTRKTLKNSTKVGLYFIDDDYDYLNNSRIPGLDDDESEEAEAPGLIDDDEEDEEEDEEEEDVDDEEEDEEEVEEEDDEEEVEEEEDKEEDDDGDDDKITDLIDIDDTDNIEIVNDIDMEEITESEISIDKLKVFLKNTNDIINIYSTITSPTYEEILRNTFCKDYLKQKLETIITENKSIVLDDLFYPTPCASTLELRIWRRLINTIVTVGIPSDDDGTTTR
uniref:Uncharacterized protein n=1 Tax=viral metagenome TaxID=1070528 RepID=A0A6C0KWE8_9ZZZZ